MARPEFGNALTVDIKADDRGTGSREGRRHGQPHVTQAYDCDFTTVRQRELTNPDRRGGPRRGTHF